MDTIEIKTAVYLVTVNLFDHENIEEDKIRARINLMNITGVKSVQEVANVE